MEVEISNIFLDFLCNYLISLLDIVEKYQAYSLFDFKVTAKLKKNIHLTLLKEATYRGLLQSNLSHPSCPIMPFDLLKLLLVVSLHIFLGSTHLYRLQSIISDVVPLHMLQQFHAVSLPL